MTECKRFQVSGKVQGVFYRASARKKAIQLGLKGWVRNTRSGDVELIACGDESQLTDLEKWLHEGPRLADVSVVKSEASALEDFKKFRIRF